VIELQEPHTDLLAAVKAEYPDDQDPLTLLLWDLTEVSAYDTRGWVMRSGRRTSSLCPRRFGR
jgi:hypothetical protein